jgi:hypothetical protein
MQEQAGRAGARLNSQDARRRAPSHRGKLPDLVSIVEAQGNFCYAYGTEKGTERRCP